MNRYVPLLHSVFGTITNGLYLIILFLVIDSTLGAYSLASLSWSIQAFNLICFFSVFGFSTLALTELGREGSSRLGFYKYAVEKITFRSLKLVGFLISLIFFAVLIWSIDLKLTSIALLSVSILPTSIIKFHMAYVSGNGDLKIFSLISCFRLIVLILVIYIIQYTIDLNSLHIPVALLLTDTLAVLIFCHKYLKLVNRIKQPYRNLKNLELKLGTNSLISEITNRLDILIAGLILSPQLASSFSLLSQFARIPLFGSVAFNRVLMPQIANSKATLTDQSLLKIILKNHILMICLSMFVAVALIYSSLTSYSPILNELKENSYMLIVFSIMVTAFSLQSFPGVYASIFISLGFEKIQLFRQFITLVVFLFLLLFLTQIYSIAGAAAAIGITYLQHVWNIPFILYFKLKLKKVALHILQTCILLTVLYSVLLVLLYI